MNINLPWPPSANRYWRFWNRKIIISREAIEYKKSVRQCSYTWPVKRINGRLELMIVAFPPDKRPRDLDNLLKITIDSLESAALFENDSQIDKITIERGEVIKNGYLSVLINKYREG